jgi:GTPase
VHRRAAPQELRIAVLGRVDAGKSTLVGVLTKGQLDNGQGLARMQVSQSVRFGFDVLPSITSITPPTHPSYSRCFATGTR